MQCVLEDTLSLSQKTHNQYICYQTIIFPLFDFFVLNNIYNNWFCYIFDFSKGVCYK